MPTKTFRVHFLIGRDTTACGARASAFSTRSGTEVTCPRCQPRVRKESTTTKEPS